MTSLPFQKCRAKCRSPVYMLMVQQRQINQQDSNSKKVSFHNCTGIYAEHVNVVWELIQESRFSCWRTSLVCIVISRGYYRGRTWNTYKKWEKSSRMSLNRNYFMDKEKTFRRKKYTPFLDPRCSQPNRNLHLLSQALILLVQFLQFISIIPIFYKVAIEEQLSMLTN